MPLMRGTSPEIISENIAEMVNNGHDEKQAVAAAYRAAGKYRKPKGVGKLKRPTLHPNHPFNLPHAPD